MKKLFLILTFCAVLSFPRLGMSENGYDLWLRYAKVEDKVMCDSYTSMLKSITVVGNSATADAIRKELKTGLIGLLGCETIAFSDQFSKNTDLFVATSASPQINSWGLTETLKNLGSEGFLIKTQKDGKRSRIVIASETEIGALYGTFHFLRLLQTNSAISDLNIEEKPLIAHRILNHWDNLDRTVERGYAGFSIWDWQKLPDYIDQRYIDYARANASVGINGTVLTNVNANSWVLTPAFLLKVKALADAFRPYGIKVYLTARFSSPIELGKLKTADPLDEDVQNWWKQKIDEIYSLIPDFGGFLVKANSEGQPGPQNYKRTHADGANMLADALAPHNGIVMWRAFVYSAEVNEDRAKQAYNEFVPLDGKFKSNVLVQVKNGAIDFQPREPFHPMFGAMPKTPLMMEFQITQEYTGCATHLFYEAPLFKEVLDEDTYAKGKGSTVAKVIDGSLENHSVSGIAGVANIGNDINWCGHPFAQANWYSYGRLAWNHTLQPKQIADEWIGMTFSTDTVFVNTVSKMMMESRENLVNYMTPIGLHHIMATNHHYGPGPWVNNLGRPDWNPVYYHNADAKGVGFDRTSKGSDAVSQYFPEVRNKYNSIDSCPLNVMLWFHHLDWDYKLSTGNTVWDEICLRYNKGTRAAEQMQKTWESLSQYVDEDRFKKVDSFLGIQAKEAAWWRDACMLYFQQYSKMEFPAGCAQPQKTLQECISIENKYVPGIKNE